MCRTGLNADATITPPVPNVKTMIPCHARGASTPQLSRFGQFSQIDHMSDYTGARLKSKIRLDKLDKIWYD
jgi:hypothetical protein